MSIYGRIASVLSGCRLPTQHVLDLRAGNELEPQHTFSGMRGGTTSEGQDDDKYRLRVVKYDSMLAEDVDCRPGNHTNDSQRSVVQQA